MFHSLPESEKMRYEMDNLGPEHGGLKGVGYLRVRNRKLPARDKGRPICDVHLPCFKIRIVRSFRRVEMAHIDATQVNFNSSFILKRELGPRNVSLDRMPWPDNYTGMEIT